MTAEILLISLVLLFLIHTPIAVAIGVASALAILVQGDFPLMMIAQRMFGGVDSFHLMAVPLFMFTGVIMEPRGTSRRTTDLVNALVGWLPGGLAAV
ncbi:MAG: TRAP transporter large permease subunit, partial [Desulfobacterales bacterium]|nr:TRAP transporter large permease subunit [Desulfobacterales bacterium]